MNKNQKQLWIIQADFSTVKLLTRLGINELIINNTPEHFTYIGYWVSKLFVRKI